MEKIWQGETVFCLASGPSLTRNDCELVRATGKKTIVTNCTFETAPWAHVIFAVDHKWWKTYYEHVPKTAALWTSSREAVKKFHVKHFNGLPPYNSGQQAIQLAAHLGASRIILLGYDVQLTNGKTHHHGDHVAGLGNPNHRRCAMWRAQFARLAKTFKPSKVEIINCSRTTALSCFPKAPLEKYL